jgi:hypothetical protein
VSVIIITIWLLLRFCFGGGGDDEVARGQVAS